MVELLEFLCNPLYAQRQIQEDIHEIAGGGKYEWSLNVCAS